MAVVDLPRPETLVERIEADKKPDPQARQREAFYKFTCDYWLDNRRSMRGFNFGHIVTVDAIPENLQEVDEFRPGLQTATMLSLDTSQLSAEKFTWHINSYGRYGRTLRALTISDYGIGAAVQYQCLVPSLGGTSWILEPGEADASRLTSLIDTTRNLVAQAIGLPKHL